MGDSGVCTLAERYEDVMDGFGSEGLAGAEVEEIAPSAERRGLPGARGPTP